jgi:hypothetical protein
MRYNFDRSLRLRRPIVVGRGRGRTAEASCRAIRDRSSTARAGAGTVWASSAFDLAQGLEITVFETRMSIEDLDELFR